MIPTKCIQNVRFTIFMKKGQVNFVTSPLSVNGRNPNCPCLSIYSFKTLINVSYFLMIEDSVNVFDQWPLQHAFQVTWHCHRSLTVFEQLLLIGRRYSLQSSQTTSNCSFCSAKSTDMQHDLFKTSHTHDLDLRSTFKVDLVRPNCKSVNALSHTFQSSGHVYRPSLWGVCDWRVLILSGFLLLQSLLPAVKQKEPHQVRVPGKMQLDERKMLV